MIIWVLYVIVGMREPAALYEFPTERRCESMAAQITAADNAIAYCQMEARI